ncbi:MAG TPA: hypothetical protein VH008_28235 [Pseudonocardia sp.]|jgi:hypothetical protein|nr:hypothetical protein [Pseudonocardia sp.]
MTPLARSPLRRFVTDGLRDTIDSYAADDLPLHRFVWELDSRLTTLAEHTGLPHRRTLTALWSAHDALAMIDTELRETGRHRADPVERHALAAAVTALRTTLARLDPPDPVDPAPVAVTVLRPDGHVPVRAAAQQPRPRPVVTELHNRPVFEPLGLPGVQFGNRRPDPQRRTCPGCSSVTTGRRRRVAPRGTADRTDPLPTAQTVHSLCCRYTVCADPR